MSIAKKPTAARALRDRSTGLVVFGIIQILLGCLCVAMGMWMAAIATAVPIVRTPQGQAMSALMMVPAAGSYLLLGFVLIWLGVGSIRARRWAWTLTVITSWMWLIMGAIAFVGFVFTADSVTSVSLGQKGRENVPPEVIWAIQLVSGAVVFCIYILLPALFLRFYQQASVRATCLRRDPQVPWTDRCPMPVLALSILLASSALSMLSILPYGCAVPLFGRFVYGPAGLALAMLMALAVAYLAWGTYRLQMIAWWGTLLLWTAGIANMVITFTQVDLLDMYKKSGLRASELEAIRKSGFAESTSNWAPLLALAIAVPCVGYLLYVRRYFVLAAGTPSVASGEK